MRSFIAIVTVGAVAWATTCCAQEPDKAEAIKATYMVTGLHCGPCATTIEGSLKKASGIKSIKVDFKGKYATVEFDENTISAQAIARSISATPHMMGRNMQYGGVLLISIPELTDDSFGAKAAAAVRKVDGVANATPYPKQR